MCEPSCRNHYEELHIPKTFRIANHTYSVEFSDFVEVDGEEVYGYHSNMELKIMLALKVHVEDRIIWLTSEQIKNTFWHELFHAFNYFWNNDEDESLAQVFANFMREFEITGVYGKDV